MKRHRAHFLGVAGKEVGHGRDPREEIQGGILEGSWGPDLYHLHPPEARHMGRWVNPCFDWSGCGLCCEGEELDGSGWASALLEYFP